MNTKRRPSSTAAAGEATLRQLAVMVTTVIFAAVPSRADVPAEEPPIVEVLVVGQTVDAFYPWQDSTPGFRSGYGIMVDAGRVLTTESLVRGHRLVEIRRPRSGKKVRATVEISDDHVNLALLRVVASPALPDTKAVPIADVFPDSRKLDIVQIDETAQIQRGKAQLLHVAMTPLPAAPHESLTFSVLSELNVNGAGVPVFVGNTLAGLIMSHDNGSRTADVVPYPVIRQFLDDVDGGHYRGFASAGFHWTSLVDPAKREYLRVKQDSGGILVLSTVIGTGAADALMPNDVILSWDGHMIDELGFYEDPDFGRLSFSYLIKGRRRPGDTASAVLVRDGQTLTVAVGLARHEDGASLIPENVIEEQPEYLVEGGLVLRELTGRYLRAHGARWRQMVDSRLVHLYVTAGSAPRAPGERVVVVSAILPDPINIGYQSVRNMIVTHVNGKPVANMTDVFDIADAEGTVNRLTLCSVGVDIVLAAESLAEANSRLALLYRIPALRYRRGGAGESGDVPLTNSLNAAENNNKRLHRQLPED